MWYSRKKKGSRKFRCSAGGGWLHSVQNWQHTGVQTSRRRRVCCAVGECQFNYRWRILFCTLLEIWGCSISLYWFNFFGFSSGIFLTATHGGVALRVRDACSVQREVRWGRSRKGRGSFRRITTADSDGGGRGNDGALPWRRCRPPAPGRPQPHPTRTSIHTQCCTSGSQTVGVCTITLRYLLYMLLYK